MKIGLSWLREYVEVNVDARTLADKLDMSGTKVEAIREPAGAISKVIAAEVLAVEPHPNADNLVLVDVRSGDGDESRVVCGAKNFTVGDRVPYAQVGARLPGMEITERKIRGEVSRGMLCSAAELGISRDHSGILVLPPEIEVGSDVVESLHLNDTVLELELTPNRPDCMGMIGVAREVAALLGTDLRIPEADPDVAGDMRSPLRVDIEDPEGCPRYVARYARVSMAPSPLWMAARLMAAGVRPISNVVDVTNYVLMETGHPLHAFDAERVEKARIVVRRARAGERLVTLDGATRELHSEDLLIADPRRALALAGVMGGGDSEVSDSTTAIILESAYFDPVTIARTSRRHLLRTEASARFEKGADPEIPPYSAARALVLLTELADAQVAAAAVDAYPVPVTRRTITLRPSRTDHILGYRVPAERQAHLLSSIGLRVGQEEPLDVEIPGFRPDLQAEIDLVEEVARLAGFDKLTSTLPPGRAGSLDATQRAERHLKRAFASLGVYEAWTSSFTSARALAQLGLEETHPAVTTLVPLHNPMSEDENVMRTTLLPGLLHAAAHNVARGNADGALFEIARVYERRFDATPEDPLPAERRALGGVAWGRRLHKSWQRPEVEWDFFGAKGTLEAALGVLGIPTLDYTVAKGMPFHPTRAASVSLDGKQIGVLGEIHPDVCDRLDLRPGTVAWEIALAPLLASLPGRAQAVEPSRFPPVFFDLALVVDERVAAGQVRSLIIEAGAPQVVAVRLFDVYRGDQVPPGKKSLAYALEMRQRDRTLSEAETTEVRERILAVLGERVGASLRT